jgi:hypothetical protein
VVLFGLGFRVLLNLGVWVVLSVLALAFGFVSTMVDWIGLDTLTNRFLNSVLSIACAVRRGFYSCVAILHYLSVDPRVILALME